MWIILDIQWPVGGIGIGGKKQGGSGSLCLCPSSIVMQDALCIAKLDALSSAPKNMGVGSASNA